MMRHRRHKTRATIESKCGDKTVWRIESATLGVYWATEDDKTGQLAVTTGVRKQPVGATRLEAIIDRVTNAISLAKSKAGQ